MIIFNRHYLTAVNQWHGVQTYTDNPIIKINNTPDHIKQWWEMYPENFAPSKIYVSDMQRTHQTASMLGYNEVIEDARVKELPLPEYEGEHVSAVNVKWVNTPQFNEIFQAHTDGLITFWNELDKSQDVLIFTHGITVRLFYYLIAGIKVPKYFPDIFKLDVGVLGSLRVNYDAGLTSKPTFVNIDHGNPFNYERN